MINVPDKEAEVMALIRGLTDAQLDVALAQVKVLGFILSLKSLRGQKRTPARSLKPPESGRLINPAQEAKWTWK